MIKVLTLTVFLGAALNISAASKIYKYTDEDGNIHYSDKKPFEGAEEAKLKAITIIKSSNLESEPRSTSKRSRHKEKFKAYNFDDFIISNPIDNETIWGTGGNVSVSVFINGKLPPNYRIKFYLDDLPHGKVKSNSQLIADVERGEHTLYAQVIDDFTRKVIRTSPKITFYIKQQSKK
ncbi:MAG: DUF4124 domain-containing protein [Alcanivoracaceae bacterium]|nr:DUF4124 domain-containing protein [Alcanivoracaceae bacterium]